MNPEPSLGIQTVFHRERNNIWVSCQPRTKQPDNFLSTVLESNEHGLYFPVFVDRKAVSEHFNLDIRLCRNEGFEQIIQMPSNTHIMMEIFTIFHNKSAVLLCTETLKVTTKVSG